MKDEECPSEAFITEGESYLQSAREGLALLLERVADQGLQILSSKQSHIVDAKHGIYEFVKSDLRLFYFKGQDSVIVVCTAGIIKQSQKANKKMVSEAMRLQRQYRESIANGDLELTCPEES